MKNSLLLPKKKEPKTYVLKNKISFYLNCYNPLKVPHKLIWSSKIIIKKTLLIKKKMYIVIKIPFSQEPDHCNIKARKKLFLIKKFHKQKKNLLSQVN